MTIDSFHRIRRRLNLIAGTDAEATVRRVTHGASLTAENLWLLVCSAILASIGLDTSSAAVIIGAMLISPLMGPILGIGLGFGVTDRHLLQLSLRELALGTLFSLGASALYFLISPFAAPTPELIARTRPTLLDVGVAFFGGVAGIVAGSRRDLSMALPGVAIATALMPPICTAGFGLATGNWSFLAGALYLYLLNAVFIALATFLVVRLLRFPQHMEATPRARQLELRLVATVAIIAILPSAFFLYDSALKLRENRRIASFVAREVERPGRAAPQWEHLHDASNEVLKIYVAGHPIEPVEADSLRAALARYQLGRLQLELVQSDISGRDLARLEGQVQRGILGAVSTALAARDSAAQLRARSDSVRFMSLVSELSAAFPEIAEIAFVPRLNLIGSDSLARRGGFLVTFGRRTTASSRRDILTRAQSLVRARVGADTLMVVER